MTTAPTSHLDVPEAHRTYVRNMAHLWRYDPDLARCLDAVPDDDRTPVAPTKSGDWTATAQDQEGRQVALHSKYDPKREAESLIDSVEIESQYCFFVAGFGLGYHLKALRTRIGPECLIVVAEPDLRLLAAAFAHVDLTALLADGKLIVITAIEKAQLHEKLQQHTALVMLGSRLISHPPSARVAGDFHRQMRTMITEFAAYSRMTLMTLVANAQITCKNIANNLACYASTPPIDILRNRYRGYPAIIVSAGPSLRKNIDQLAEARGRAVICAVQTTLKTLLDRGIKPDFVTSLDYHAISAEYFEGLEGMDDVHLVAEPKASWHVLDTYDGPVSLLNNSFASLLIGDELGKREALSAGATVAHLAFYLARYMGCDPIVFVGQDLAYTGYVYYAPGVEIHRTWRSEINRFNTLETKEWDRTVRARPVLRKTVDNEGRPIYTDDLLFTYLEQFERDIGQTTARVINATEGGARIRGAEAMSLAEVLDRYCQSPIPPERFAYREATTWRDRSKLPAVCDEIRARLDENDTMVEMCGEMLGLLERLLGLLDNPPAFNKLLVRVDELRARVNQAQRALQVINTTSQLAELRRFSADRKLSAAQAEGVERAKRQLHRDIEFVTAVRDGGAIVGDMLTEALTRVEQTRAGDEE